MDPLPGKSRPIDTDWLSCPQSIDGDGKYGEGTKRYGISAVSERVALNHDSPT